MDELAQLFEGVPTSIISDSLRRLAGTRTLVPRHKSAALVGVAYTVKVRSGDNLHIHDALRKAQPGQVLVIDGEGHTDRALLGEIMMSVARMRGLAGFVVHGAIRDADAFVKHDFPCYSRGVTHQGPLKNGPGDLAIAIAIEGCVVHPGDIVVGDGDGVVFIPRDQAASVAAASRRKMQAEAQVLAGIVKGEYDDAWIDQALAAQLV
ncbi:diguanylate cyclase [Advenella kashmirensis W13003]|uniref:Putative 4-hydroxy-4-methyl-2-oxoglutarate aldolase n=1 Tax=Advenella kashmirensis W13003 TaxID=1424334 RepID=V8QP40_9BURK|nr:diguanylate cyclase [Advenella kashmirensis]ETF00764.1 diguanylate cyclase [Advenella kashmirensis W13003]